MSKIINQEMETLLGSDTIFIIPKIGDIVEGVVLIKEENKMIIGLGNVFCGEISGTELVDNNNTFADTNIGDTVEVMVVDDEDRNGLIALSLRRALAKHTWSILNTSFTDGNSVKVKVKSANTGGLIVDINGAKGFLPVSQLSPEHYPRVEGGHTEKILERLRSLIDQTLETKIINFDPTIHKVIFSEKAMQAEKRKSLITKLEAGQKINGRVTGIFTYGLFVAFGELEGLVHISEIAWNHVSSPHKYAKVNDQVDAVILSTENDKISLSMKRLLDDPWVNVGNKFKIGKTIKVKVKQFVDFGMFVEMADNIGGLIHISQIDWDNVTKDEIKIRYSIGDTIDAKIILLDIENHKIGLSIKELTEMPAHLKDEVEITKSKKKEVIIEKESKKVDLDSEIDKLVADSKEAA